MLPPTLTGIGGLAYIGVDRIVADRLVELVAAVLVIDVPVHAVREAAFQPQHRAIGLVGGDRLRAAEVERPPCPA